MRSKLFKFTIIASVLLVVSVLLTRTTTRVENELSNGKKYFVGNELLLESPISENRFFRIQLSGVTHEVYFPFSEPLTVNGFSVFFPGNSKDTTSYLPTEFDVYYKDEEGIWVLAEEVTGFNQSSYKLLMKESKEVLGFRIDVKTAFNKGIVQVSDFKPLVYKRVNLIEFLRSVLFRYNKTFISRVFYTLFFLIFLLVPGSVICNKIFPNDKSLSNVYKLILGPILSLVAMSVFSIFYIVSGVRFLLYGYLIIFIFSLPVFIKDKLYTWFEDNREAILIALSSIFILILLQNYREGLFNLPYIEHEIDGFTYLPVDSYFSYHIDNTLPWAISRSFLHRVSIFSDLSANFRFGHPALSVLDKPPLLSVILVPILGVFGESHFIYMQFMTVLVSLFFSTFYLIFKTRFQYRVAIITSLLLLLSVPLTFRIPNIEVYHKFFAIYPILVAILIENHKDFKGKYWLIGLLLIIGFLIHPMILLISAAFPLVFLLKEKNRRASFKKTLKVILPLSIFVLLFFSITAYLRQGHLDGVDRNLYVGMIFNIDKKILKSKLLNVISVFLPDMLMLRHRIFAKDTSFMDLSTWYFDTFLLRSFIASITPAFFWVGLKRIFSGKFNKQVSLLLYVGVPTLLLFLLIPHYASGWHMQFNFILVPVFLLFVTDIVEDMKLKSKKFLYVSYIIFSFISLYRISWVFNDMTYNIPSIVWSFRFILITYFVLAFCLLKFALYNDVVSKKKLVSIVTTFFKLDLGGVKTRFNEIKKSLFRKEEFNRENWKR